MDGLKRPGMFQCSSQVTLWHHEAWGPNFKLNPPLNVHTPGRHRLCPIVGGSGKELLLPYPGKGFHFPYGFPQFCAGAEPRRGREEKREREPIKEEEGNKIWPYASGHGNPVPHVPPHPSNLMPLPLTHLVLADGGLTWILTQSPLLLESAMMLCNTSQDPLLLRSWHRLKEPVFRQQTSLVRVELPVTWVKAQGCSGVSQITQIFWKCKHGIWQVRKTRLISLQK